jgi:hypothetical protein
VLSGIGDILGDIDSIAVSTDLLVCSKKTFGSLICRGLSLSTEKVSTAGTTVAKSDGSLKLRTVEERICAITNTRRIIIALIVVGEGTPLRTSIDDTITQNQSAGATNHITRRELLDEVGWNLLAVLANKCHVQVLTPFCSALLNGRRWCNHLWRVRLWPVDIVEFVEYETLALLATKLLSLARDSSTSSEIFRRFLAEEVGSKLEKEWGMRFGGIGEKYLRCVMAVKIDDPASRHLVAA